MCACNRRKGAMRKTTCHPLQLKAKANFRPKCHQNSRKKVFDLTPRSGEKCLCEMHSEKVFLLFMGLVKCAERAMVKRGEKGGDFLFKNLHRTNTSPRGVRGRSEQKLQGKGNANELKRQKKKKEKPTNVENAEERQI